LSEFEAIRVNAAEYRKWVTSDVLDFPGSAFYHPDFLENAARVLGLDFQPLLCFSAGRELTGIANLLEGGRFGVRTCTIPRLFQYYGPVAFCDGQVTLDKLLEEIARTADTAVFSLTPEQSAIYGDSAWNRESRLTYYLKPDRYNVLRKHSFKNVKRRSNRATKAGVQFQRSSSFLYGLYKASFERQRRRPPVGERQLTDWVQTLMDLELAETYVAVAEAKPAAFLTILHSGRYACSWLSGALPDYLHLGVNNFVLLKTGEELYTKGVDTWDLVGGDVRSIGEFKRSFGAEPRLHLQLERSFNLKGRIYRSLMKLRAGLDA